jgi:CRISPR/Cas system CSM-associated protein Csm2 small subunit
MPKSQARAQRRMYEKFLKKTNPSAYKEWKTGVKERGAKLHIENVNSAQLIEAETFESVQSIEIQKMRDEGKTQEEIDEFVSSYLSGKA